MSDREEEQVPVSEQCGTEWWEECLLLLGYDIDGYCPTKMPDYVKSLIGVLSNCVYILVLYYFIAFSYRHASSLFCACTVFKRSLLNVEILHGNQLCNTVQSVIKCLKESMCTVC